MKNAAKTLILTATFALSSSMTFADCAQEISALEAEMADGSHEGIAKDGTLAPLQKPTSGASGTASNDQTSDERAKEGESAASEETAVAPMDSTQSETSGPDTDQAMSGQDAQSQQSGGMTAAQEAEDTSKDNRPPETTAHSEALSKARAALEKGDEAACLKALEGLS
ncbi:hypothetical protein [Paracoccus sp. (in: a-proteobacteria)]|uniref:hypothetical protein n=1 Tax=Paracoccus sp. TaxID=267 RepID=UPI0028A038D1|nr:hypothetical protein [Paracoccus sp. (in: a-proteobacteria)]